LEQSMKVVPYSRSHGQTKMNGRKHAMYSCGCCDIFDFRDDLLWKEAANEMKYDQEEDDELEPAA